MRMKLSWLSWIGVWGAGALSLVTTSRLEISATNRHKHTHTHTHTHTHIYIHIGTLLYRAILGCLYEVVVTTKCMSFTSQMIVSKVWQTLRFFFVKIRLQNWQLPLLDNPRMFCLLVLLSWSCYCNTVRTLDCFDKSAPRSHNNSEVDNNKSRNDVHSEVNLGWIVFCTRMLQMYGSSWMYWCSALKQNYVYTW